MNDKRKEKNHDNGICMKEFGIGLSRVGERRVAPSNRESTVKIIFNFEKLLSSVDYYRSFVTARPVTTAIIVRRVIQMPVSLGN